MIDPDRTQKGAFCHTLSPPPHYLTASKEFDKPPRKSFIYSLHGECLADSFLLSRQLEYGIVLLWLETKQ